MEFLGKTMEFLGKTMETPTKTVLFRGRVSAADMASGLPTVADDWERGAGPVETVFQAGGFSFFWLGGGGGLGFWLFSLFL